jgi:hypothetical protein
LEVFWVPWVLLGWWSACICQEPSNPHR